MQRNMTVLKNVLSTQGLDSLHWTSWPQPGRHGADIHRLYDIRNESVNEEAFIVRFGPGAHGDEHQHHGFELMFILSGDLTIGDAGTYSVGDLIVEEPDSVHQVSSRDGAVVLCIRHGEAVGVGPGEMRS